ncbi:MAG: TonB-dependent receptor [Gammaproteobacteria bacterium]|nr:TonB-dependent receptor [Gammaproteobacteria bacterium]
MYPIYYCPPHLVYIALLGNPVPGKIFIPLSFFCVVAFAAQHAAHAELVVEITDGISAIPAEPGDVDQQMNAGFVHIIDEQTIRDNQLNLAQILASDSSIKVRQLSGFGSYSQLSIRGKSADQVMIYLDGLLLNNASGGSVDLSQIPSSMIARIEVYKDVVPVEFGQAANGGAINIITHRASQLSRAELGLGAGSFDTHKADFTYGGNHDKWRYVLSGAYMESENNFPYRHANGSPKNPEDDYLTHRNNNQFHQQSLMGKAAYRLSEKRVVHYHGEISGKNNHIPSISNSADVDTNLNWNNRFLQIAYQDDGESVENVEFKLSGKSGYKNTLYDDSERSIGLTPTRLSEDINLWESAAFFKFKQPGYQILNRTELRHERLELNDAFDLYAHKLNKRTTFANALQLPVRFFNGNWVVTPSMRIFLVTDDFSGNTNTESENTGRLKKRFQTLTAQIGTRLRYSNNLVFKANAGQYFRLPNYVELFGTRGYIGSNESLQPEEGINFDAGYEYSKSTKSEILTQFVWNVSLYHSIISNEIVYTFNSQEIGMPSNNWSSSVSGIEHRLALGLFYDAELSSSTTVQLPINRTDAKEWKLLPGRSWLMQTTRMSYNALRYQLFAEHVWESSYYIDSEQRLASGVKAFLNAGVDANYRALKLSFEINNIFNRPYKDYFFQVAPGRYALLSVKYRYQ